MIRVEAATGRQPYVQKGQTERLLCQDCDNFLNTSYEQPFRKVWYEDGLAPDLSPDKTSTHVSGLDYAPFKLFHLSILWRASVASGMDFSPVDLGPHEKRLRQMVLNGEPGKPHEFPLMGTALIHQGKLAVGPVMLPAMWKEHSMRFYALIYGGVAWEIAVASHCPRVVQRRAFTTDGTLTLPVQAFLQHPSVEAGLRRHWSHRRE